MGRCCHVEERSFLRQDDKQHRPRQTAQRRQTASGLTKNCWNDKIIDPLFHNIFPVNPL